MQRMHRYFLFGGVKNLLVSLYIRLTDALKREIALLAGSIGALAIQAPVMAGSYEAICSMGGRCTVILAAGKITLPTVEIEKENILSWSQGGSGSKTDVGMGVATTVLFGLPGLIGFGAKKHDYQFSISHVDESGNLQIESIKFVNNTPANQFMMELMGLTGLSMGAVNSDLQARREEIAAAKAEEERIANLECGPVLKTYQCSWSKYLEANPSVAAWAEKYPAMAEQERIKQGAVE